MRESNDETQLLIDLEATWAFGASLARRLPSGAVLLLRGSLGSGKTSLVQGIAAELGIGEPITSPTFALAQHYPEGHPPLVHLDLYRLEIPAAADDLFLQEEEEARAMGALMAVEWPERLRLPLPDAWQVTLSCTSSEGRNVRLQRPGHGVHREITSNTGHNDIDAFKNP